MWAQSRQSKGTRSPPLEIPGFRVDLNGTYHVTVHAEGVERKTWLCAPIQVETLVRNFDSVNWSYLLRFMDSDGHAHHLKVAAEDLFNDNFRRALMHEGLLCSTSPKTREWLTDFIQSYPCNNRQIQVESTGWVEETAFVLPDEIFGFLSSGLNEPVYLDSQAQEFLAAYQTAESLDGWQNEVARYCEGNPPLVLGLCETFLAPLLRPLDLDNIGVHVRGSSSTGKTKTLMVEASVWGDPSKFVSSWRTTDNALELIAASRNDSILILDELAALDPGSASNAV